MIVKVVAQADAAGDVLIQCEVRGRLRQVLQIGAFTEQLKSLLPE